jgi:hypothetical protein
MKMGGRYRRHEIGVRWEAVRDGLVCSNCYNAYEPSPTCERREYGGIGYPSVECRDRAHIREVVVGSTSSSITRKGERPAEHNYCRKHAPSTEQRRADRRAERDRIWRAEFDAKMAADELRRRIEQAAADVVAEAQRWRNDERATEGFCDEGCEHHECRLARAIATYEEIAS